MEFNKQKYEIMYQDCDLVGILKKFISIANVTKPYSSDAMLRELIKDIKNDPNNDQVFNHHIFLFKVDDEIFRDVVNLKKSAITVNGKDFQFINHINNIKCSSIDDESNYYVSGSLASFNYINKIHAFNNDNGFARICNRLSVLYQVLMDNEYDKDISSINSRIILMNSTDNLHLADELLHRGMTVKFTVAYDTLQDLVSLVADISSISVNVDINGDYKFIIPEWFDEYNTNALLNDTIMDRRNIHTVANYDDAYILYDVCKDAVSICNKLLDNYTSEQLLKILPGSISTTVVVTARLGEWYEIFKRCAKLNINPEIKHLMASLMIDINSSEKYKDMKLFNNINPDHILVDDNVNREIVKKVEAYEVNYLCPKCNEGHMVYDRVNGEVVILKDPNRIPHTCDKCGYSMEMSNMYPYVDFRNQE